MAATRRGTGEIGRSLLDLSMAATGGEPEDREITLDLNHLWIHRGGPSQEVARVGGVFCWWRGSYVGARGGHSAMDAFPRKHLC